MPEDRKREATTRDELAADRERARARSEAKFEELLPFYPEGHAVGRDTFVRRESEKVEKDIEKRHLDAIPEADRRRLLGR